MRVLGTAIYKAIGEDSSGYYYNYDYGMEMKQVGFNLNYSNAEISNSELLYNCEIDVDGSLKQPNIIYKNFGLFDGTIEGLRYTTKPILSIQHHPEASPGPHESSELFAEFFEKNQLNPGPLL